MSSPSETSESARRTVERLNELVEAVQQLLAEELAHLARQVSGGLEAPAILQSLTPALQGLLKGMVAGDAGPYRVLGLDPGARDEVVKLVYRHLARRLHPDAGGSAEAMAQLNRAYEEIAKERGWK